MHGSTGSVPALSLGPAFSGVTKSTSPIWLRRIRRSQEAKRQTIGGSEPGSDSKLRMLALEDDDAQAMAAAAHGPGGRARVPALRRVRRATGARAGTAAGAQDKGQEEDGKSKWGRRPASPEGRDSSCAKPLGGRRRADHRPRVRWGWRGTSGLERAAPAPLIGASAASDRYCPPPKKNG